MWAKEANFYQIYPLGICKADYKNNHNGEISHNLGKIEEQIPHIKNLGANAIYFSPIFSSTTHGYDSADYYRIDERLGTNDEFAALCKNFHNNGIKIVLDGVFNHVGRDFWAFRDVLKNKGNSMYCDWFFIKWDTNNHFNDGFSYLDWEGAAELVKLNLKNYYVREHIFNAVKFWVENFDIDGIRLDVAYLLDRDFLRELHHFTKSLKPDFWLLGEAIHGDYNSIMNDEMLDSATNYECFKGLYSSFNSKNMFEIAHSIKRQENLYKNKHLYMFLDNHDVSRIATNLNDERDLKLAYSLMFALPGIPSVYYQSEFGIKGDKKQGDGALRPQSAFYGFNDLTYHIQNLCKINSKHKSLAYGKYNEIKLSNEFYCFSREIENEKAICAINISEKAQNINADGININLKPKNAQIFINGACVSNV